MEQWKTVITHPNYEVSDLGRVRNKTTNEFKAMKPGKDGYIQLHLFKEGKSKTFMVHRLVATHFIDNPENKEYVNHKDSTRYNNFVENLEWCTQSENMLHMVSVGNNIDHNGINNPRSKLTEEQVIAIRNDDRVMGDIAKDYGVSRSAISNIKSGKRYKNVGGPIKANGRETNQVMGDKCGKSVITDDIARQIRYELTDMRQIDIARKFNITKNIVYRVVHGISFKHI